jgi:hypothetical protein
MNIIKLLLNKQITKLENDLYYNFRKKAEDMEERICSELWDAVYELRNKFKQHAMVLEEKNKPFKDINRNLQIIKKFLVDLSSSKEIHSLKEND